MTWNDIPALRKRLKEKGWADYEIEATVEMIERAPENKSRFVRILDDVIYWFVMILAIAGNFALSVVLIPFLIGVRGHYVYGILLLFGIVFGSLFNFLVQEIEVIEPGQHILGWLFIPVIALVNVYIIASLTNTFLEVSKFAENMHSPLLAGVIYAFAFMIPYMYTSKGKKFLKSFVSHALLGKLL